MARWTRLSVAAAILIGFAATSRAGDLRESLKAGNPEIKTAGPLAFGPEGILFVGDSQSGAVFAIDTNDHEPGKTEPIQAKNLHQAIAGMLGTEPQQILVNDLAINPISGQAYLSISRGRSPDAEPVIVRVDRGGKLVALELEDIPFARAELPGLPAADSNDERGRSPRAQAITDLIFTDGRLFVTGLSNEEFSSRLLAIPFPFTSAGDSASVEIYHGAHGRFETRSPVRTFISYELEGKPHILAAYTCTPLVKIPVEQLQAGAHVKGTTIAELGNRNTPLDMVAYQKDGKNFILIANTSRGVMKVSADGAESAEAITKPIAETAGLDYSTIENLKGVVQLDQLDANHAVVLMQTEDGALNLETIELP